MFNAPLHLSLVAMIGCYVLSRTRYYNTAGILAMLALVFPSFYRAISLGFGAEPGLFFQTLVWLIVPLVLARLVLSIRGMTSVAALYLGA